MRRTQKILSIFLALMMVISIIPITASAATYSGTCGDNLTWTYDSSTYNLTISGTGDMYDYKYNNRPWESYKNSIRQIFISDGVTSIGVYAFYNLPKTTNITIPDSVTAIRKMAFANCYKLVNVILPNNVEIIGEQAFYACTTLTNVVIPKSVTVIEKNAFFLCENLTSITVDKNNQHYSSDEYGALFNKDKTVLVQYPSNNCETIYSIPESVTEICRYAFDDCFNLKNVIVPTGVITLDKYAFNYQNYNLIIYYNGTEMQWNSLINSNNIGDYITSYTVHCLDKTLYPSGMCGNNLAWMYDNSTGTLTISGVGQMCNYEFNEHSGLGSYPWADFTYVIEHIIIKNGITTIGACAFTACKNLIDIQLNNSVTSINADAFRFCLNIKDVYFTGTEEQWKEISVGGSNQPLLNATIHYNYVPPFTGIKDNHFYKDDVMQKAYQLVEFEGDFYFIGDRHEIVKNKRVYLTEERIKGLTYADGTPIQVGYYEFDANGKMVMREGIVGNHIYKNNTQLKAYQLVEVDGDFYYISDRHEFVKNKRVYLKEDRINGLTYADGTPIQVGYYDFDENGKMVILNGIVGNSIYKNNTKLKAYQLVEIDGDFYLIGDRHEIVKNKTTYLNEARLNGLTYADGTPIAPGYYDFDEDGKMVIINGVVGNKIYKNNTMLKAYQLVEVDGDFYYIGDRHEIIKGRKAYVKEDRINGLTYADGTPITAGYYEFDENGKMIIE